MSPSLARAVPPLATGLARTWRLEVEGEDHVQQLKRGGVPVVFVVWHGRLLAPLWHRRNQSIGLLVSGHQDGGYLAYAATQWGYRVLRGSSTRGGVSGLKGVLRVLRTGGHAAFAPDGPRGPATRAKPGALAAARLAEGAVIPVGAHADRAWQLRSWDAMQIPRPFARIRVVYGTPLRPPAQAGPADAQLLDAALQWAQERARCCS